MTLEFRKYLQKTLGYHYLSDVLTEEEQEKLADFWDRALQGLVVPEIPKEMLQSVVPKLRSSYEKFSALKKPTVAQIVRRNRQVPIQQPTVVQQPLSLLDLLDD